MPQYRLYCLGGDGKIESRHDIDTQSDEDAIMVARSKKLPVKCELWDRGRKVAVIDAHRPHRAFRLRLSDLL
jgi:hypothetical protein